MVGESFLRGSVEVGTRLPAVRLRVFSDAGWAGSFDGRGAEWLFSAGAGLSVLDGLLRLDVSRALRAPTDWRVSLQLDGWL
jgi:outer membrane protein assembly factor BamA